jgi:glycosyltransferase involved in cell wall biosynthesis
VVQQRVRYWLTDDTVAEPGPVAEALTEAPGLLRGHLTSQSDLYAAADVVVLPSTWEGWGLPVVEAAAAGRLVVAGPYPVLDEIRALGITVHDPSELTEVATLLANPLSAHPLLEANRAAVRTHLDLNELPAVLSRLATHAQQLL